MKFTLVVVAFAAVGLPSANAATNPISKVMEMLSVMQTKITAEGEKAKKTYEELAEWCEDESKSLAFAIKTETAEVEELKATIEEESALISSKTSKIDELSGKISAAEADLKSGTAIRKKDATDFAAESKELSEVIDTLERSIRILEREMHGGASMAQLQSANTVAEALATMVDASMFSSADAGRLTALVQSAQQSADGDSEGELGAPAAPVYESHSSGIIDTLEGLLEKAQTQLSEAQKNEATASHNFEMLKQSLEDEIKFASKDMDEAKTSMAASSEKMAAAQGDLEATSKDLQTDKETERKLHMDCMTKAQDFEASTKSREEELSALAAAKKVIAETTGAAAEGTYGLSQTSFIQRPSSESAINGPLAALRVVRKLAGKHDSASLTQLVSRLSTVVSFGSREDADPFAKVRGLISDMIDKLEQEAGADATHKAYCDKELAESGAKKEDKQTEIEKLTTKIDQMTSKSSKLKEEVATLQTELAELAKSQAVMDQLRTKEHADFVTTKAELEQGVEGVKIALKILREYYAKDDKSHSAAEGGSSGIISLLEVAESDFSKGLAETIATEESAQTNYDEQAKQNALDKATKSQDVKYKTKESASLDKAVAESTNDRSGVQAQFDAVLEYLKKLEDMCVAKPEAYEERTKARAEQIAGLKEALETLEGETALVQRSTSRKLRGAKQHFVAVA